MKKPYKIKKKIMILWDNVKQCVLYCLWTCVKLWEEDSYLALARHKS